MTIMQIGHTIKSRRKELGITQTVLAGLLSSTTFFRMVMPI